MAGFAMLLPPSLAELRAFRQLSQPQDKAGGAAHTWRTLRRAPRPSLVDMQPGRNATRLPLPLLGQPRKRVRPIGLHLLSRGKQTQP